MTLLGWEYFLKGRYWFMIGISQGGLLEFLVHEVPTNCPTWSNEECRCMVENE